MSLLAILLSLFVFPSTQEFDLTVSIDGYSEIKGDMHIGVYNKVEGFREIDQTFANKIRNAQTERDLFDLSLLLWSFVWSETQEVQQQQHPLPCINSKRIESQVS